MEMIANTQYNSVYSHRKLSRSAQGCAAHVSAVEEGSVEEATLSLLSALGL